MGGQQQGAQQPPMQGAQRGVQGPQQTQTRGQSGMQRGQPGGIQPQQVGGARSAPPTQGRGAPQAGQIQGAQSGAGLLQPLSIDDVVQTDVYTVERDTQVREIVEEMGDLEVGTAIVTEDDTPIGVVTDRKIALALSEEPNVVEQTADDLIEGEVVSAMEGTKVSEVLEKMSSEGIRRLPVVDENGELQGVIALDDVIMLLDDKMSDVADTIEQQLPEV